MNSQRLIRYLANASKRHTENIMYISVDPDQILVYTVRQCVPGQTFKKIHEVRRKVRRNLEVCNISGKYLSPSYILLAI